MATEPSSAGSQSRFSEINVLQSASSINGLPKVCWIKRKSTNFNKQPMFLTHLKWKSYSQLISKTFCRLFPHFRFALCSNLRLVSLFDVADDADGDENSCSNGHKMKNKPCSSQPVEECFQCLDRFFIKLINDRKVTKYRKPANPISG